MIRRPDEDHLHFASIEGRALYSFNGGDFHEIHTAWISSGRHHSGIILAQQQRYSTGEQIRRMLRLVGSHSAEAMRNRDEFLERWRPRWHQSPFSSDREEKLATRLQFTRD
jgi:hypothetical protein